VLPAGRAQDVRELVASLAARGFGDRR